jgi:hypothetical protein
MMVYHKTKIMKTNSEQVSIISWMLWLWLFKMIQKWNSTSEWSEECLPSSQKSFCISQASPEKWSNRIHSFIRDLWELALTTMDADKSLAKLSAIWWCDSLIPKSKRWGNFWLTLSLKAWEWALISKGKEDKCSILREESSLSLTLVPQWIGLCPIEFIRVDVL